MKIKINKNEIVNLVSISQKAISSRNPVQILDGILFIARDNKLKLISTDIEMTIETSTDCIVEESGELVINSGLFGDIVRNLPNGLVNINTNMTSVEIKSGNSQFHLTGQESDEFPLSPSIDENSESFDISGNKLKKAVRETEFATSLDVTRPHLNGIFLEKKNSNLRFVAIDGYRLAISDLEVENDSLGDLELIVQKKALNELCKFIGDDDRVSVKKSKTHILFETENTKMYSRLIDKKYLDYMAILSVDIKSKIKVNRLDLLRSIERASLLLREGRVNLVKLSISDNTINVSSNSEIGNSNEDINCEIDGESVNIAFNARYLIDGLKVIEEDEVVLKANGELDPMEIVPSRSNDFLYLVLPVRVGR